MTCNGIERQLEDLIAAQEAQGLNTGVGITDGNQSIADMDGRRAPICRRTSYRGTIGINFYSRREKGDF